MKRGILIVLVALFIFSANIYAELIDGPANIRELPNGKIIFSLNNDVHVQCKDYNENWYYISLIVWLTKDEVIDGKQIKKNSILFDSKGNEIGKTLDLITPTGREKLFYSNVWKTYSCELGGYTVKNNIQQNVKPNLENIDPLVLKLQGRWISDDYISFIKMTKSPFKASKSIKWWPTFQFSQEDRGIMFGASTTDFHQGIGDGISSFAELQQKGYYKVICGKRFPDYPCIFTLSVMDDPIINQITIVDMDSQEKFIYHRMKEKSVEEIVNKLILVGTYKDNKGKKYIFNKNQVAIWPNKTFKYRVALDSVFNSFDMLYLVNDKEFSIGTSYSFEIRGAKISLFNTKPVEQGEGDIREEKPFLILNKTN